MSFKITPTENRKVKYITLTWDFGKHPIEVGGEFPPFFFHESQDSSNLVIPKGSAIVFSMSETVKTISASGNVVGCFLTDGGSIFSPAGIIPNSGGTVGTIYVNQWGAGVYRKLQNKCLLRLYSFGPLTEGIISFTVGFLPGGGYEYLNE